MVLPTAEIIFASAPLAVSLVALMVAAYTHTARSSRAAALAQDPNLGRYKDIFHAAERAIGIDIGLLQHAEREGDKYSQKNARLNLEMQMDIVKDVRDAVLSTGRQGSRLLEEIDRRIGYGSFKKAEDYLAFRSLSGSSKN